jgi:oligopeptide/dipeptide ABC transporter ATP-binding protein
VPSPINTPSGCRFHTSCRYAFEHCSQEPAMREVLPGHHLACHLREVQTAAFSNAAAITV